MTTKSNSSQIKSIFNLLMNNIWIKETTHTFNVAYVDTFSALFTWTVSTLNIFSEYSTHTLVIFCWHFHGKHWNTAYISVVMIYIFFILDFITVDDCQTFSGLFKWLYMCVKKKWRSGFYCKSHDHITRKLIVITETKTSHGAGEEIHSVSATM